MQKIKCKNCFSEKMMLKLNKNLAEFIGIMLGDGSLSIKNQTRLKISFHSKEQEYTNFVKTLTQKIFGISPIIKNRKNENTTDLFSFRKNVVESLLNFGLKESPKWERAIIPSKLLNSNFELDVLRGYFDTDGSVVLANNNGILYPRLEMKVCPSPMQAQFIKILRKYGFRFGAYQIGKGKIRIQMNGKSQLNKWLKLINSNNPKHLQKAKRVLKNG